MKVLVVSEFYPPILGGLEIHVAGLAEELQRRGHDVEVATLGPVESLQQEGAIRVHRIKSTASRLRSLHADPTRPFHLPIPDPEAWWCLKQILGTFRPDVVHAHNWMAASLARTGTPLVLTAHDYAWACPKRTLLRPDKTICSGPSLTRCVPCSAERYGKGKAVLVDLTTRLGRKWVRPDAHIAVSEAVATAVAPFTRSEPVVVPNFAPAKVESVPAATLSGLPSKPFALFAGSASGHKGIDVLTEAWAERPPCPLVVAALDVGTRTWPQDVSVVSLNRAEMSMAWSRASVGVVPSVWADPCPTAALEALSFGVPVVASSVGGLVDLVDDGITGRLVPPGDPIALREAVATLIDDPNLRSQMGAAARKRAEVYSVRSVVDEIERIYARVVGARAAHG